MNDLEPKFTKVRVYVHRDQAQQVETLMGVLDPDSSASLIDATALFELADGQKIIEIVALRLHIHQRIVPMLREALPGTFVTMEAVCGFMIPKNGRHQMY